MDMRSGSIGKPAGETDLPLLKSKQPRRRKDDGLDGVRITREEARHTNTREQDRHPVPAQPCRVTYRGGDFEAEIVNLSGGGAMIAAGLRPHVAERLHLHLGEGGTVECVVRWVKPGRMGLEFAHETQLDCSDEERVALLLDVIDRSFKDARNAAATRPPSNPDESDESDQRIATRHPLIWSGELHGRSGSWHVRLRNVSATGALVQCGKPLPVGREVVLDLGKGGSVEATVSWAVGDHAGLRFDEPFDMRRLSHSKPRVAPARWLRPAYLESEVPADSAWDDAWSRMSVDELKTELEGFLKR
jgi:PilZ domain